MAACLAPHNVCRTHQSLHHLVADSPWSAQTLLARVRGWALPLMKKKEPLVAQRDSPAWPNHARRNTVDLEPLSRGSGVGS